MSVKGILSVKISIWKSCLLLAGVFILPFVIVGCYQGFGRKLFYRLEYHKFKVVDPEGRPIKNVTATFSYKSNFDISGKHSLFHHERIKFDDNGEASRFGWVRHEPRLHSFWAEGVYSHDDHRYPIHDNCTIVLLRRRDPTPLGYREIWFELEDRYQGKLQFRFEDLELSIPYTREERLAYRWNEKGKKGEWSRKSNTYYRPDIVFDFKPNGAIETEFASAVCVKPVRYDSVFHGVYEAPSEGYGKITLSRSNYKDPVVFTFPYREREKIGYSYREKEKLCYGIMTELFFDNKNYPRYPTRWIRFQFYLNLSGNRKLEGATGYDIPQGSRRWSGVRKFSPEQSELWRNGRIVRIAPLAVLDEFRNRKPDIPKAKPRVGPKKIFELRSEKIRYVFWGKIVNGIPEFEQIQYVLQYNTGFIFMPYITITSGCEPEILDVNFDGIPDLLIHRGCENGVHRYRFFCSMGDGGRTVRIVEMPPSFCVNLSGKLAFDPVKRLIHVTQKNTDGNIIRKTYQINAEGRSYLAPGYLTEYHPSSNDTSANWP